MKPRLNLSGQSSSLLLGVALATLLSQSALLCQTRSLSGFGWAVIAGLAGCLYSTLSHWNGLVHTLVPESSTWKRAIFAGCLLAAGLFMLGQSLTASSWSPIFAVAVAFIPWSRALWRRLFAGDTLVQISERVGAFVMLIAAILFLLPDLLEFKHIIQTSQSGRTLHLTLTSDWADLPRATVFLAALFFGGASSLQRPQERSISTQTYWAIPTAVAAIVLSTSGWVALHISGSRKALLGSLDQLPIHRVFAVSPAILFGIVLLALRPQLHIRNSLRIGKEMTHWWQALGLSAGIIASYLLFSGKSLAVLRESDVLTLIALLVGQFVGLRCTRREVRFAPALASVPVIETTETLVTSKQI